MVRLIDADALVKDLRENYIFTGFNELLDDFASAIRAQPTVDTMPVIRCKDCKNAKCIHEEDDWWECSEGHRVMHGNGFCSWAERKEE